MGTPKLKYRINQNVYVFTKNGLEPMKIGKINIQILEKETTVTYYSSEYSYDGYKENQIIADYPKAKKKLEENANQLSLLLN